LIKAVIARRGCTKEYSVVTGLKKRVSILREGLPKNIYKLESNCITSAIHIHSGGNCKGIKNSELILLIVYKV